MSDGTSLYDQRGYLDLKPIGGISYDPVMNPPEKTLPEQEVTASHIPYEKNTVGYDIPATNDVKDSTVGVLKQKYDVTPIGYDKALAGAKVLGSALQASSNSAPTTNAGSAAVQAGSTALQSGVAGATIGSVFGPVGTAVGGAAGLVIGGVLGGVNAWMNVSESRKQQRAYERLRAEAIARADKQRAEDMGIAAEETRYNRRVAADAGRVDQYNAVRSSIVNLMNSDSEMRKNFIKTGIN